jgi:uncharacterized protein (TIGR02246 family)
LAVLAGALAAQADEQATRDAETAVRAASQRYVEALARGDAEAIAAMWTEDGVYVDAAGESFVARDLVRREFGEAVGGAKRPEREAAKVNSAIRFLNDDVALEEGTTTASEVEFDRTGGVRFSAVWVLEGDAWQLDHLREHAMQPTVKPTPLEELSWFIGDWTAEGDGLVATLSASWSDDGKYLMQRFTIRRDGQDELNAEQRIAWDPADEVIRSWSFHSDGGFVEGELKHEGEVWAVATVGVLPNGDRTTSNNLWVPDGPDSCWFKLHGGTVAGADAAELMVQFKRKSGSR